MGKVLDPIIVNPPKPNSTQPFNREDIEKIAFNVLADLGDEVINKAIQEGKITIPQNIDVASLTHIGDVDSLTTEEVEQLKGKCFFSDGDDMVYYPITAADIVVWFGFDKINLLTCTYRYIDNEWIYNENNPSYNLSIMGGTKLYKHYINYSVTVGNVSQSNNFIIISTSNKNYKTDTFEIADRDANLTSYSFVQLYRDANNVYFPVQIFFERDPATKYFKIRTSSNETVTNPTINLDIVTEL